MIKKVSEAERWALFDQGVYTITNSIAGKMYLGGSENLKRRWRLHLSRLRNNIHPNKFLQEAFNQDTKDAFTFDSLIICDKESTLFFEQRCLDFWLPKGRLYNICPRADSRLGAVWSLEATQRIAQARTGHVTSEETKTRISKAQMGRTKGPLSDAHKKAFSRLGREHLIETKEKISKALIGRILSEETKQKISTALSGKARPPHTAEQKKARSERMFVTWQKRREGV